MKPLSMKFGHHQARYSCNDAGINCTSLEILMLIFMRINVFFGFIFLWIIISCNHNETVYIASEKLLDPRGIYQETAPEYHMVSSYDTTGGNIDRINLKEGKTAVLMDKKGQGLIKRVWIRIDETNSDLLRGILLRMFWDNAKEPAVSVPLADFFSLGQNRDAVSTFYTFSNGTEFLSHFPMPFVKGARIELINQSSEELPELYYKIDYYTFRDSIRPDCPRFYAAWNRDHQTENDTDYVVLATKGSGFMAGLNLTVHGYNIKPAFIASDERIWIDAARIPAAHGTGIEDLFDVQSKTDFSGVSVDDANTFSAWRFFAGAPVFFNKSLLFTIEHGHDNQEVLDISSTVFWYQSGRDVHLSEIERASMRKYPKAYVPYDAHEAEKLIFESRDNIEVSTKNMTDCAPDWGNDAMLLIASRNLSRFSLAIPHLAENAYNADVYMNTGPYMGNIYVSPAGKPQSQYLDAYAPVYGHAPVMHFENVPVRDGRLQMDFRIMGKNPYSAEFYAGIDAIKVSPVRKFIPNWSLSQVFPAKRFSDHLRLGLDSLFYPEEIVYHENGSVSEEAYSLRRVFPDDEGLLKHPDETQYNYGIFYARIFVYAPEKMEKTLLIGCGTGHKVFLNDQELFRNSDLTYAEADKNAIPLPLGKGWNELVIKSEWLRENQGFYARIPDAANELRYSLYPK